MTRTERTLTAGVHVRAEGFSYQHPDRPDPALAGLDLEIAAGETVLLAGASGAGKSTLLHAAAGVQEAAEAVSTGQLLLDGLTPGSSRGRVGLVHQDPESQVVLSRVGDDVAFACENLAVPADEIPARVQQALEAVGLDGLGVDHPTAQLSGGQKQRLALAGILAMRPGLLLLDEPTANLDPEGTQQVRDTVINACRATGATLIVVEHRLQTWVDHLDTLLVLETGGGVRHRVAAAELHQDPQLRAQLVDVGLWVPAHDPLTDLPAWSPPAISGQKPLLRAAGLAVHRQRPGASWRRAPVPTPTLSQVDLEVASASTTAITGPNGVGKSTLLLTMGGLLPPHHGDVEADPALKGEDGQQLPGSPCRWTDAQLSSRIGTVFQVPDHQFLRSTVAGELRLALHTARPPTAGRPPMTEDEFSAEVDRLLDHLGLGLLAQANPFTLSGGEKRRLSVATALASGVQILMLDEPTFGQDAHTFTAVISLLREHLDRGGSIVAVTHDAAFLRALDAEERALDPAQRPRPTAASPTVPAASVGLPSQRDTSWLGRRGALGKLAALVLITVALISTIDAVSAAAVALACFALLPVAGIRVTSFLKRIWIFALGALIAVWGAALAAEESGPVLVDLGITTISAGSLELGVALGARAFAIVLPSVLVFSTTDPTDLADSLAQQVKLPTRFVLGALAAMRILSLLTAHWTTLGHARRARGLGRKFFSQAFGLLVQAVRMAARLAVTMESRGFGAGERTWARRARFTRADGAVVVGGLLIAALATSLAIAAGTWNLVWLS